MAFTPKTYTAGQTVITADNLNDIQDVLVKLSDNGSIIYNVADKAMVNNSTIDICTISIPAQPEKHLYLVLCSTSGSISDSSSIISCGLSRVDSNSSWVIVGESSKSTLSAGGGASTWGILETTENTATTIAVTGYGYYSGSMTYRGKICAIKIH